MEDGKRKTKARKKKYSYVKTNWMLSIQIMKTSNSPNYYALSSMALQLLGHEQTLQRYTILFQLCGKSMVLMMFTNSSDAAVARLSVDIRSDA